MKRVVTSVSRMANQLVDPKPEFVSLVGHGANQTPFNAVKSEICDFRSIDNEEKRGHTDTESVAKARSLNEEAMPSQAEIHKVTLSKARFASDVDAKAYLEAKGYTDFMLEASDTEFTVAAKSADSFAGEIKPIAIEEGVTFYVGQLAESAEGLEMSKTTKAAKTEAVSVFKCGDLTADALVKKYDYWPSGMSSGKTIQEVMADAADGGFPGMYELNDAFWYALYNCVRDGDKAGIAALCAEFGQLIVKVLTAFESAGNNATAMKEAFMTKPVAEEAKKSETPEIAASVAEATPAEAPAVEAEKAPVAETPAEAAAPVEGEATEEAKADEDTSDKRKSGSKTKKDDEAVIPPTDIAALIAKAVTDAVSPLNDSIKAVTAQVAEIQKGTSEGLADLTAKVSKAGERVAELEAARQTRKSADDEGVAPGTQVIEKKSAERTQKVDDHLFQMSLGMRGTL